MITYTGASRDRKNRRQAMLGLPEERKPNKLYLIAVRSVIVIGGVVLGFLLCRIFITPHTVSDDSMRPVYKSGDRILILKHATPVKGDVVLMESPVETDRVLLKRVAATEGDIIEIRDKVFYLNNKKYEFKWNPLSLDGRSFPMTFTKRDSMPSVKLKRNEYFVIGDNLDYSFDGRSFGIIGSERMIGRVIYKY